MTLFEKSTSMQIIPFPTHYQSVYTNFDISSFSLISCYTKVPFLKPKSATFGLQKPYYCNAKIWFLQSIGN